MKKILYFAYGSNLNHYQMKKKRCIGSKFIQRTFLKNYTLSFCNSNKKRIYGYANAVKAKSSKLPGAIWLITTKHEKILDYYEEFPKAYIKSYFKLGRRKVMFYTMDTCSYKKPSKRYVNIVKEGYKDCRLDLNYLKKKLAYYSINYFIR